MDAPPERHTKYLAGYGLILVVIWALVGLSTATRPLELIPAGLLQLMVGGALWLWRPGAPSTVRFMLGTAALVASAALLRDATRSNPGVSVLDLLPMMVAAIRASRRELAFAWGLSALAMYLPEIIVGAPQYGIVQLRGVTLMLLVGIAIALIVLQLVRELASEQHRLMRMTEEAHLQLSTEDALRQVATLVAAGAPAAELFMEVSQQLARIAGASMGAVVRFSDPDIGEMVGVWRADRRLLSGAKVDLHGGSAAAHVRRTGRSITVNADPGQEGVGGATAAVAAPIAVGGALWGSATAVFRDGEPIPAGTQARFERFAELVAMAIANADNVSQLVERATTDGLTQIPNRRTFDQALTIELERAIRRNEPLAIVLLDIDHFKRVNDTYGHQAGDVVLARVAGVLADQARSGETVARLGGEEFVWLMPATTAEEAVVATERARQLVGAIDFPDVGRITLSAGVNSNVRDRSEALLLSGADEALYAAKSRGRDQTVAAPASLSAADARVKPAAA